MTSLIAFRRVVTPIFTYTLRLPDLGHAKHTASLRHLLTTLAPQGQQAVQELATLPDGRTVVTLFDGFTLPDDQPAEIKGSIEVLPAPLPTNLLAIIKLASPLVCLINARVATAIAERYSLADEIKLIRTAPSPEMSAYNDYAEECRAWGRAEKAKLGL